MPEIIVTARPEIRPPANLKIYQLRPIAADRAKLQEIGAPFGLRTAVEHGTIAETALSINYTEGPWTMRLFRPSGGWKHRHAGLWQRDNGEADLRIADDEAVGLARAQILKYKLADENEIRPLRVTRLRVAHCERGKPASDERVVDVGVVHERVLDGLPVEGPGGKTVVYLDQELQLSGIDHLSRQIASVHEPVSALRPVDYAVEQVKRRFQGSGPGRVEVTEIRLGYFEMNYHHVQEYLQPAYVVFVRLVSQDEHIHMPVVLAFPAAQNSVGTIEPEPSPQPRQPVRR